MTMMTTTKSSDTTTATKRSHPADDDEKFNDKLEFLQRKLEATNKSILSALIQHEEEQKDEKKETKMLHLLHELPLDTENEEELINEKATAVSDCNVVDEVETKDTDKDVSNDDDDTAVQTRRRVSQLQFS